MSSRGFRLACAAVLAYAAALRLVGLDKGMWLDEYLLYATITDSEFWARLRREIHPPLFYLPYWLVSVLGGSEPALRLASAVFGWSTVALLMLWLRRESRLAAVVAGVIAASLPILLRYSHELRGYPLLLLATTSAFYLADRVAREPRAAGGYVGFALAATVLVCTHLVGVMLLPALAAYIIAAAGERRRELNPAAGALALATPGLAFGLMYWVFLLRLPTVSSGYWMPRPRWSHLGDIANRYGQPRHFTAPGRFLESHWPGAETVYVWCLIGLLVLTGLAALRGDLRRSWPALAAALVYWVTLVSFSLLVLPILWFRTAMPGLIPLIAFFALQLATCSPSWLALAGRISMALLCLLYAAIWTDHRARQPQERWRSMAAEVRAKWQPGDVVLVYPAYARGIARHYLDDLPTGAVRAVGSLDRRVPDRLPLAEPDRHAATHFVFVRNDATLRRDSAEVEGLRDRLSQQLGPPRSDARRGAIWLAVYDGRGGDEAIFDQ